MGVCLAIKPDTWNKVVITEQSGSTHSLSQQFVRLHNLTIALKVQYLDQECSHIGIHFDKLWYHSRSILKALARPSLKDDSEKSNLNILQKGVSVAHL